MQFRINFIDEDCSSLVKRREDPTEIAEQPHSPLGVESVLFEEHNRLFADNFIVFVKDIKIRFYINVIHIFVFGFDLPGHQRGINLHLGVDIKNIVLRFNRSNLILDYFKIRNTDIRTLQNVQSLLLVFPVLHGVDIK